MANKQDKVYTVSQINSLIKTVLDENLPSSFVVSGEITGFKIHSSGHCYFSLKDDKSQLPCIMWASSFKSVKFEPENGLAVYAKGYIDIYSPQGKYQFYTEKLDPAGVGSLQIAFEQMVIKLKAEGLFDEEHKKPLPKFPQRIAILTSDSGAAIGDITTSIYSRWQAVELLLFPVAVQGAGAADEIAKTIKKINTQNKILNIDLAIVGRGGGSLEDLWAFNEEVLARAIFKSKIPIISAVGHEYDTTIADLVADARASTPTKAGVIAVPDKEDVVNTLERFHKVINVNLKSKIQIAKQLSEKLAFSQFFRNPQTILANPKQQTDETTSALKLLLSNRLKQAMQTLQVCQNKIAGFKPDDYVKLKANELYRIQDKLSQFHKTKMINANQSLCLLEKALSSAAVRNLSNKASVLDSSAKHLNALNPKTILTRGYSITRLQKSGKLLTDSNTVKAGDLIITELADKTNIISQINKID